MIGRARTAICRQICRQTSLSLNAQNFTAIVCSTISSISNFARPVAELACVWCTTRLAKTSWDQTVIPDR